MDIYQWSDFTSVFRGFVIIRVGLSGIQEDCRIEHDGPMLQRENSRLETSLGHSSCRGCSALVPPIARGAMLAGPLLTTTDADGQTIVITNIIGCKTVWDRDASVLNMGSI